MSESPKPGQVWRDRESGIEITVRQIVGESATYVGEAVIGSCPLVDWDLHFEREVRAMSDNTERDKLRSEIADVISGIQVGTGYESVTIGITAALEAADAILADFLPEHDKRVKADHLCSAAKKVWDECCQWHDEQGMGVQESRAALDRRES